MVQNQTAQHATGAFNTANLATILEHSSNSNLVKSFAAAAPSEMVASGGVLKSKAKPSAAKIGSLAGNPGVADQRKTKSRDYALQMRHSNQQQRQSASPDV